MCLSSENWYDSLLWLFVVVYFDDLLFIFLVLNRLLYVMTMSLHNPYYNYYHIKMMIHIDYIQNLYTLFLLFQFTIFLLQFTSFYIMYQLPRYCYIFVLQCFSISILVKGYVSSWQYWHLEFDYVFNLTRDIRNHMSFYF